MYTIAHLYLPADTSIKVGKDLVGSVLSRFHATGVRNISQYASVLPDGNALDENPISEHQNLMPEEAIAELVGSDSLSYFLSIAPGDKWYQWLWQDMPSMIPKEVAGSLNIVDFACWFGPSEFTDLLSERRVHVPQCAIHFSGDGSPNHPAEFLKLLSRVPAIVDIQRSVEEYTGVPWNFAISGCY